MTVTKVTFDSFLNYLVKIIAPMLVIIGVCGSSYWKFYIEPRIEERMKPLTIFVLENNLILRRIAPDSVKKSVNDELQSYQKYLNVNYKKLP